MSRPTPVATGPYAPPAPDRELTVRSVDGARLHVEVHGPEGAPPVVLVHGWTCSTAFWAAQIRALAADHRVIAYDLRGHGRSLARACLSDQVGPEKQPVSAQSSGAWRVQLQGGEGSRREGGPPARACSSVEESGTDDNAADVRARPRDAELIGKAGPGPTCSTEALADDLEAVLAATLAPGERAVVVGHSMGGMTVLAAAARPRFRAHTAAVLLCSTGSARLVAESLVVPMRAGRLRTWLTARVLSSRAPLGPVTPVSRRILKYATLGAASTPAMVEACARVVHACPREVRHAWSRVLERLDLEEAVRELTVPTAVVVGTADRLTPPVHARALVAALPHCVGGTELPGLGHMTPVEAPELVTGKIRELVTTYAAHTPNEPVKEGA